MSFFDEADEAPRKETRTRPRAGSRIGPTRRGRGGGSGRPPGDHQTVQVRRAVALGALLVVIVLIALGVHSCQVSANNSAMQSYTGDAASLIQSSNANGQALFKALATAGSAGATTTQNAIDSAGSQARTLVTRAQQLSVPDQLRNGNANLLLALRMRADGIGQIATQIQPALNGNQTAVDAIALQTARFYASDVVYKDYSSPEIYAAMNAAGVRFAGLPSGQFVPSLTWLVPSNIARALRVRLASGRIAPGLHGHRLDSVSVAGTALQVGSPNSLASTTPTFVLSFTNTGQNAESNVVCKVTVNGTSVTGSATVAQTLPGHSYTCDVTLSSPAPAGTQTVVAAIESVPGEKNTANNSISYTVTFP